MHVLIVDDSATVRLRLADALGQIGGVIATTAACAEQAQTALHEKRTDVAIVDVHMPGGSGLELLRRIRRDRRRVVMVVVSSCAPIPLRIAAMAAGADYFFDKCGELSSLVRLIEALAVRDWGSHE